MLGLGVSPKLKFLCTSHSAGIVHDLSTKAKDIIKSKKYDTYFPYVQIRDDQDSKSNFMTTSGGQRYSTSNSVTGLHFNLIICDDNLSPDDAHSDVKREAGNDWLAKTVMNRRNDSITSTMIIVHQRLNVLDNSGFMLSLGIPFNRICLPAQKSDRIFPEHLAEFCKDGLLDPVRLPQKKLDTYLAVLGSRDFNAQYNQSPSDESDTIIKEKWF